MKLSYLYQAYLYKWKDMLTIILNIKAGLLFLAATSFEFWAACLMFKMPWHYFVLSKPKWQSYESSTINKNWMEAVNPVV